MSGAEAYVEWSGHHTWTSVHGTPSHRAPLLALHGGPGAGSDYLESLTELAGRQVILYDQFGCGRSGRSDDTTLWTIDTFLSELRAVRSALGLNDIHLLGQSWGGMLALEHVLSGAEGIRSLTLASTLASTDDWMAAVSAQREALPADVRSVIDEHEANGTTDSPAYAEAVRVFNARHVCRVTPMPEPVARSFALLEANPSVYATMWGASEFHLTGCLAGWDVRSRLGEIHVPTLITSGAHDESAPSVNSVLLDGIPGARWVLFESSAHMAHVEEADEYLRVLTEFLNEHDG